MKRGPLLTYLLILLSSYAEATNAGIPEVWSQHYYEGRPYWYNSLTGVSTWEDPHASVDVTESYQQRDAISKTSARNSLDNEARTTQAATSIRRPMRVSRRQGRVKDWKHEQNTKDTSEDKTSTESGPRSMEELLSGLQTTPSSSSEEGSPLVKEGSGNAFEVADLKLLMNTIEALNQEKDAAMDAQEKAQNEVDKLNAMLVTLKAEHEISILEIKKSENDERMKIEQNLKSKLVELKEANADIKSLEKELVSLQALAEAELKGHEDDPDEGNMNLFSLKAALKTFKSWLVPSGESSSTEERRAAGAERLLEALAKHSANRIKGIKARANKRFTEMKKEKDDLISSLHGEVEKLSAYVVTRDEIVLNKDQVITELTNVMHAAEVKADQDIARYEGIKDNLLKMTMEQDKLFSLLDTSNSEVADLTVRLTILKGLAVKLGEARDQCATQRDQLAVYYNSLIEAKETEVDELRKEIESTRAELRHALSTIDQMTVEQQAAYVPEYGGNSADPSVGISMKNEGDINYNAPQSYPYEEEPFMFSSPSASWENEYVIKDGVPKSDRDSDLDNPGF